MRKLKKELAAATSMAQAATITGFPRPFLKWSKERGCDAFRGTKINLALLRKYHAENFGEFELEAEEINDGSQEAVNRERIISMRKQQRKLDREHEVAMGSLVSVEAVKEKQGKLVGALTGILKKTLSREDYNAVARQFQKVDFGE
jgi:hypothetical protein